MFTEVFELIGEKGASLSERRHCGATSSAGRESTHVSCK